MMVTTVLCPLAASRQRKDVQFPSRAAGVILMWQGTSQCLPLHSMVDGSPLYRSCVIGDKDQGKEKLATRKWAWEKNHY